MIKRFVCLAALWPCVGFAQFLVFDDAPAKAAPTQKIQVSQSPVEMPSPAAAPVADQYKAPAAAVITGRVRTLVKHKGRKPAVFGRPVSTDQDRTVSALVVDVMPPSFQAFATSDVDMEFPVRGGRSDNWVDALAYGLRDTPFTATIDWDKREISFDMDNGKAEATSSLPHKDAAPMKKWEAKTSDGMLSSVLARWCKESGGECGGFSNLASHDFVIGSNVAFYGSFKEATDQLMSAVKEGAGSVFEIKRLAENKIGLIDMKQGF